MHPETRGRCGSLWSRVRFAPELADVGPIPCPIVDRRRACPEHEAALRACLATRAAVARGEQRFRLRTPTSRSAPGLPGRFAIPLPAMRARLPGRRVHRGHLAPAGRDGVRGVSHGAAAVNPLSRARRRGIDALLGERPRLASAPDPRRKHRPGRRHVRASQLASRPCTRGLRTSQPASSSLAGRRPRSPCPMRLGAWRAWSRIARSGGCAP